MAESAHVSNLVEIVGEYASSCGYCHSKAETSVAFGMTAERLTVQVRACCLQTLNQSLPISAIWVVVPRELLHTCSLE